MKRKAFTEWLKDHFRIRYIFTIFASRNVNVKCDLARLGLHHVGYSEYYIFGVRVAKIQKTKPWDQGG